MALPIYRRKQKGKTVEDQLDEQAVRIAKLRKADAAAADKKKNSWVTRLKKGVKTALTGPGHSPAGKKHLSKKRGY